ncbi:MAG: hypothetical protein J6T40_06660 [Clostridiales bacterium]|nr:hypothetical protein [Clostridiales bacterium]
MKKDDDLIRNGLIGISGAIPVAGGSIAFLLDKYVPSRAEQKKKAYIERLAKDIEEIKEKVSIENMDTPEFQSIFARLLHASIDEYREEKLNAFRNLTLNVLVEPKSFNKIDYFSRLVLLMVPDEILILRVFYLLDVKGELSSYDQGPKRDINMILEKVYGFQDRLYIQALIINLQIYRLILGNDAAKQKYGNGRDGLFLTDFGKSYLRYVFEPEEGFNVE